MGRNIFFFTVYTINKGSDSMTKATNNINPISIIKVGNFAKNAIKNFEEGIVNESNFLEKTNSISSKNNKK